MENIKKISGIRNKHFLINYLKYSSGFLPGLIEGLIALSLFANTLKHEDFSEWAIFEAAHIVIMSWSQLGTKFGYMQAIAKLNGKKRDGILRYVLKFNILSSLVFGIVFSLIASNFIWKNDSLIYWLPLIILSSNLLVIIQTDYRITQNPEGYLKLVLFKVIIYTVFLVLINFWSNLQLIHHYVLMSFTQLLVFIYWLSTRKIMPLCITNDEKSDVLSAIGGTWLGPFKYFADFLIPLLILDKFGLEWSSEFGKISRVIGYLELIFLTPFLMVWGSQVYFWLGEKNSDRKLKTEILFLYKITPLVIILMSGLTLAIGLVVDLKLNWTLALPLTIILIMRKVFFMTYYPSSYGIIFKQRHFFGSLLLVLEFIATALIFILPKNSVLIFILLATLPFLIACTHFFLSNKLFKEIK